MRDLGSQFWLHIRKTWRKTLVSKYPDTKTVNCDH